MMEHNFYVTYNLQNAGIDISTITSCAKNARDKTPIIYTCSCGEIVERSVRNYKDRPLCDECMPGHKITLKQFKALLEENGYQLVDPENCGYKNTKTMVQVIDCLGKTCETSYNRFSEGHRSKNMADHAQKISLKEVQKRVEEAGFTWLKNTTYKGHRTPFSVKCHCGNICEIKLEHLHKDRVGCENCYRYNRKYPWTYIEGFADKYGCTLISGKEDYKGRDTIIEIFCACGEEMIKNVRGFLKAPRCSNCSTKKREKTNIEIYGNKNYFASDIGKETIKNYYMETLGVEHNMQLKKTQDKARKTCLKNFGVECVLSTETIRKKAVEAHIEKWGAPPGCVKEIRNKSISTHMERYGCKYPMQNPTSLEKAQKSAFCLKEYCHPSGKIILVQGYENVYLDYFFGNYGDENNIFTGVKNVPKVEYLFDNTQHRYFMDAYDSKHKLGIEIKSLWTYSKDVEKNRAKWTAASLVCEGGFNIFICNKKCILFEISLLKGELLGKTTYKNGKDYEFIPFDNWDDM